METRQEVEKALVLWNISNCPIPDGLDPLMVVQRIQAAVEKSGYVRCNGEISITVIGNNLTEIPGEDVMRKLSSIGISLKNAHEYQMDLYHWAEENPAPGTMMLIDRHEQLGWLAGTLFDLENGGFRILLAYPQRDLATPFPCSFSKEWDWDAFISDTQETTTTTASLVVNFSDKMGGSPFFCEVCFVAAQSLEDFTTHLKAAEHAYEELDLLLNQDMLRRKMIKSRRGPLGPLRPQLTFNLTHSKY
ncbi:hypothetical protein Bca52824_031708 [Brassica carinata]|uniref:NYN domain-containing protein n=1 Tax=Brassica carinata TaxID=52824 RepID=A0A8X7SBP5_BRACI|nr:hypothetical protein Bca52824_031708 [Brassica carinata]